MEKIWLSSEENNKHFLDDDDIANEINDAFVCKPAKPTQPTKTNGIPPVTRPVTIINEINNAFNDDPMTAIIDSIQPHHMPSDIRRQFNNGEINQLVAWRQKADDRANAMWQNKEHVFITLVQGFLLDKSTRSQGGNVGNMATRDRDRDARIAVQVSHRQGVVLAANEVSVTPNPNGYTHVGNVKSNEDIDKTTENVGLFKFRETNQMLSKTGFDISGVGNVGPNASQQEVQRQEEVRYLRRLEEVANVIDTTATSGQEEMSREMLMAVGVALNTLARIDSDKFMGKKRQDFYNDETAMTLFAELVGSEISLMRYSNPDRYYKDLNFKDMKIRVERIATQMRQQLCWSHPKRSFVKATPQDIKENRQRRAEEMRKAILGINF